MTVEQICVESVGGAIGGLLTAFVLSLPTLIRFSMSVPGRIRTYHENRLWQRKQQEAQDRRDGKHGPDAARAQRDRDWLDEMD